MRAVASAFYILTGIFVGFALGPVVIGQISDTFSRSGMGAADALRDAMLLALLAGIPALAFFALGGRHIGRDESTRLARARELGELV